MFSGRDLSNKSLEISEKSMLWALFHMIGALALRLTGERLLVKLETDDQSYHKWVCSSPSMTRWLKPGEQVFCPVESAESCVCPREPSGMLLEPPAAQSATEKEAV